MLKRNKLALAILIGIIFVLLSLQTPLLRGARSLAWSFWLNTIARAFNIGPLAATESLTDSLAQLTAENTRLQAELRDYQHLKEQLGTPTYESLRAINGVVIGRPLDTFRNQITINRGSRQGVTPGAAVVVHGSTLIGFIVDLYEETSVVQLLLHPSTNLAAEIASETTPRGLLVGRHYSSLAIITIPQDAKIEPGQKVVSVTREALPHGLLIGTIGTIERRENEAYQEATVNLPYDPDNLRAVTILVLP